VDAFLPPYDPRQVLDPAEPVSIGAMVGPEAFTEVRYLMHAKQMQALDLIPELAGKFSQAFGRSSGGLVRGYRSADADLIVVALGSVLGTIAEVVDELREQGVKAGAVGIKCFRPFPLEEVAAALANAREVVVLEKAFAPGLGGIVGQNVRLSGIAAPVFDVVAGLGGRPITMRSLHALLADVMEGGLEPRRLHFLDLDRSLVERELRRTRESRRSGPHAENILRDLGVVGAGSH
jgi:pyruvate ferredoxin oxidoreductase alpha subunit